MNWLYKAMLTALVVAAVLTLLRRFGGGTAGRLTGLPIVTVPALVWLTQAHGTAFAVDAVGGCVAAGGLCSLFGLGYALASRRARPLASLIGGAATALSGLGLLLLVERPGRLGLLLGSLAICLACSAALQQPAFARRRLPVDRPTREPGSSAWSPCAATAVAAGVLSGATDLLAADLGPFGCGVLSSSPLVSAIVACRLHRAGEAVLPFLRGYVGALVWRIGFVASFGLCVGRIGAVPALLCAGLAVGAVAWAATRLAAALWPVLFAGRPAGR